MILQSVYHLIDNNKHTTLMQDKGQQQILIGHKEWSEMGSPDEVSVTIMRLRERKAVK